MDKDKKWEIIRGATEGPWETGYHAQRYHIREYTNNYREPLFRLYGNTNKGEMTAPIGQRENDALFCVTARTEWPKDLARVEELEKQNKELIEVNEQLKSQTNRRIACQERDEARRQATEWEEKYKNLCVKNTEKIDKIFELQTHVERLGLIVDEYQGEIIGRDDHKPDCKLAALLSKNDK